MEYILNKDHLPVFYLKNLGLSGESSASIGLNYILPPGKIKALHYHEGAEIGICVSGSGVTYIGDRIYRYRKGDIQYISPYVAHLSASDENCGESVWVWISFSPVRMMMVQNLNIAFSLNISEVSGYSGIFSRGENYYLAMLIERFKYLLSKKEAYDEVEVALLVGLIVKETGRFEDKGPRSLSQSGGRSVTEKAILYISENFSDSESLAERKIADQCEVSCSHLRSLFKKETGMSVRDFIINTKLAAAAHSLRRTNLPVLRVSLDSGFGQISCFNRLFRRVYGVTPTEYRKISKC